MNEKIKTAIVKFEELQKKFSKFGAWDTEPCANLHWVIKQSIDSIEINFDKPNFWELYSSEKGWGLAGHHLTRQAKQIVKLIKEEARMTDVEELKNYAWRA